MNSAEAIRLRDEIREKLSLLEDWIVFTTRTDAIDEAIRKFETGALDDWFTRVVMVVAREFLIPANLLFTRQRPNEIVIPRQIAMSFCYGNGENHSLTEVGRYFGRDHGTVLYSIRAVRNYREVDRALRSKIERIEARLKNEPASVN